MQLLKLLFSPAWQSTEQGLRPVAITEKVQVEEKGLWSTYTVCEVFIMLQSGQDTAPCETQASESHFGDTKLDPNDHFKRVTSLFPRQIFSLHKTYFSGFRNKY